MAASGKAPTQSRAYYQKNRGLEGEAARSVARWARPRFSLGREGLNVGADEVIVRIYLPWCPNAIIRRQSNPNHPQQSQQATRFAVARQYRLKLCWPWWRCGESNPGLDAFLSRSNRTAAAKIMHSGARSSSPDRPQGLIQPKCPGLPVSIALWAWHVPRRQGRHILYRSRPRRPVGFRGRARNVAIGKHGRGG